jgi:hypothetical protein
VEATQQALRDDGASADQRGGAAGLGISEGRTAKALPMHAPLLLTDLLLAVLCVSAGCAWAGPHL